MELPFLDKKQTMTATNGFVVIMVFHESQVRNQRGNCTCTEALDIHTLLSCVMLCYLVLCYLKNLEKIFLWPQIPLIYLL
jgi:hypothetical protein